MNLRHCLKGRFSLLIMLFLLTGEGPFAQTLQSDYFLGPGDKINVSVFGRPDLSGEHTVRPSGELSLPLLGEVMVSGVSVPELESRIADAYSALMQADSAIAPEINVNVEIRRHRPFFILGDVSKPGDYEYQGGLTVLRAVAIAGGYASSGPDARVDETRARESLNILLNSYLAGVAREARLIAEREGLEQIEFPPELMERQEEPFVAEILDVELQLFELRKELTERELAIIEKRRTQFGEEDEALKAQAVAVEGKRKEIENLLAAIQTLISKGVMPKSEQFSLLIMLADVEGESRELVVSRSRAQQGISAMEQEALILRGERDREIASELERVRIDLDQTLVRLRAEADRLAILEVKVVTDEDEVKGKSKPMPRITRETPDGPVKIEATENTPVLPGDVVMIPYQEGDYFLSVPGRAKDPRALYRQAPGEL